MLHPLRLLTIRFLCVFPIAPFRKEDHIRTTKRHSGQSGPGTLPRRREALRLPYSGNNGQAGEEPEDASSGERAPGKVTTPVKVRGLGASYRRTPDEKETPHRLPVHRNGEERHR